MIKLRTALERSLKLQSHYAKVLNLHDGGGRMTFDNAEAWLTRLEFIDSHPDEEHAPSRASDFI